MTARAQERVEDSLSRRGRRGEAGRRQSGDESERIEFVGNDQPAAVDDCNREG